MSILLPRSANLFADPEPTIDPNLAREKLRTKFGLEDPEQTGAAHPTPPLPYIYTEDRKNTRPAEHLAQFSGVLQVGGYGGFKRLAGGVPINRSDWRSAE